MKAPSVTIVGRNNPNLAWKNNSGSTLEKLCEAYPDNQTQQCIEENTLGQSEVIKDILIGNKSTTKKVLEENRTNSSISYLQSLKAEFSKTMYGMTYSFDEPVEISTEKRITLCLSFNKSYSIFIHDKEFFLLNSVPSISGQSCKKLCQFFSPIIFQFLKFCTYIFGKSSFSANKLSRRGYGCFC